MHQDIQWVDKALEMITNIVRAPEVGTYYLGKVVRIEKFGAFVELWQGCEGLLHVSKISAEKVDKVEDVLAINDEIMVIVTEIDDKGRVNLACKDAYENKKDSKGKKDFHKKKDFKPRAKKEESVKETSDETNE